MTTQPETATTVPRGNLIARDKGFEIYRHIRGDFQVIRIAGSCSSALLQQLRKRVFQGKQSIAFDCSSLQNPDLVFVRELVLNARRMRNEGRHLVLLNARGVIRNLVHNASDHDLIPLVISERMLDGTAHSFSERWQIAQELSKRIRRELRADPHWRLSDREGLWLCPYCATPQDHIRIKGKGITVESIEEYVTSHLMESCEPFLKRQGSKSEQELAQALKRINQEKLLASKESASILVSKMVELQDQVKESAELRNSVEAASERQRHMLPARAPEQEGCLFGLSYHPAQRVSGDFYDFIRLPDNKLGFIIGDVSGHGVEAGILMGVAKKLIEIRMRDSADPVIALQIANRDLFPDLDRRLFVTVFAGVYDPGTRQLTYARAGHNPTILYNPERVPHTRYLDSGGMVMGSDPGPRFNPALQRGAVTLQRGDLLFLYTDGLSEAKNPADDEFEIDRIAELIGTHYASHPEKLIETIYREFVTFSQGIPQEDDVTMVAMKLTE